MTDLFKKLNFKNQEIIHIINAPESFGNEVSSMGEVCKISFSLSDTNEVAFVVIFVATQISLDEYIGILDTKAVGDAIIWFAYPKKSSKTLKCDFDRDHGWDKLGVLGYEGIRMVAIDQDWSALRFRKAAYIHKMTRSFAMSKDGKEKVVINKT